MGRKEAIINFADMTCQVADGRPRKIQRLEKKVGWLSNGYFFEAFKDTLAKAGQKVDYAAEDMFDFRYNQDFSGMKDDGRKLYRGGQQYQLPIGWKRFAVHVRCHYDDGDNTWLREDDSGWAVAYHGTSGDSLPGILSTGFSVGPRQRFAKDTGAGIYCTPWIDVAQHYSRPRKKRDHYVQIVLQLRVRPSAVRKVNTPTATEFEKKYWVINDPENIRPYGVLIRELELKDYLPPEHMVFGKNHESTLAAWKKIREEEERDAR